MADQDPNHKFLASKLDTKDEIKCIGCFELALKENLNGLCTTNMLHFAAAYGLLNECKVLITRGVDVNAKNDMGWTPVMQAVRNGHYLVTKMIIEFGGNVDLCNGYGVNAVDLAVLSKNVQLIELVSESSSIQDNGNDNMMLALQLSCLYGYTEIVQRVVSSTIINLNELSSLSDLTPLMLATITGHLDVVKLLLDHGSDPLVTNSLGYSAYDIACYRNDLRIKSLLRQEQSSPFDVRTSLTSKFSSPFVFPLSDKLTAFVLPNHISKRHSPLIPLSPFTQNPQFNFKNSPCCCFSPSPKSPQTSPFFPKPFHEFHSSGSWTTSFQDFPLPCSDIAALISPQQIMKFCNLHPSKSSIKLNSPKKAKKRKLFDKEWCSSLVTKLGKKRNKSVNESNERSLPNDIPVKSQSFIDFSQLLFDLELEEYWPIFKEHELDIGVFLTLTAKDLDIIGIKDKQSQFIILNKIEKIKRTQI